MHKAETRIVTVTKVQQVSVLLTSNSKSALISIMTSTSVCRAICKTVTFVAAAASATLAQDHMGGCRTTAYTPSAPTLEGAYELIASQSYTQVTE